MKQLVFGLALLVAGSALGQEIGTEITPTTPSSGVQNPQTSNPPPAEQPKSGYVYKPKGAKEEGGSSSSPSAAAFTGTKVSASSGDFGIRAGFGTSSTPSLGTAAGSTVAAPSLGIAYFAGDAFKLLVDLGFGLILGNNVGFALNAMVGFDYLFRTPADAMRPFFHFAGLFNMDGGGSNVGIGFGAQLGFGAEYFFSPSFSVNGRLLLSVPMTANGNFVLGIFTVTPGVGATWYL